MGKGIFNHLRRNWPQKIVFFFSIKCIMLLKIRHLFLIEAKKMLLYLIHCDSWPPGNCHKTWRTEKQSATAKNGGCCGGLAAETRHALIFFSGNGGYITENLVCVYLFVCVFLYLSVTQRMQKITFYIIFRVWTLFYVFFLSLLSVFHFHFFSEKTSILKST